MTNKDMLILKKEAESQGWVVTQTNGGHFKWLSPFGGLFFSSQSPSDHRSLSNLKRDLRVNGFISIQKKNRR
jgi:hypothetical protein